MAHFLERLLSICHHVRPVLDDFYFAQSFYSFTNFLILKRLSGDMHIFNITSSGTHMAQLVQWFQANSSTFSKYSINAVSHYILWRDMPNLLWQCNGSATSFIGFKLISLFGWTAHNWITMQRLHCCVIIANYFDPIETWCRWIITALRYLLILIWGK